MGSFLGHVVPGTFWFGFGCWWLYNVLYRYFHAKRFQPSGYKNATNFMCPCSRNVPIEPIVKVVATTFGIIGEFWTAFENGTFTHWGNGQHMTMFFYFGINGAIEILQYKKWDLPPKLDYISATLAFAVEGFLFYNHLHGRPHMDVMVHMYLFYVIVGCVISTLAEMFQPRNVMPALFRVFFTLLQATWFYQIAFVLYPPFGEKWDLEDHTQMMIVTIMFTWHMAAILGTMFGMGVLIWLRVQNSVGSLPVYQMVDTSEAPASDKDIYPANLPIHNHHQKSKHNFTNGHVHFDKSNTNPSIRQILDSDSEEA